MHTLLPLCKVSGFLFMGNWAEAVIAFYGQLSRTHIMHTTDVYHHSMTWMLILFYVSGRISTC
jgi:hypothetical protein